MPRKRHKARRPIMSGLTVAAIRALPREGAIVLVHDECLRDDIERMARDLLGKVHFSKIEIRVVSGADDISRLRGCGVKIVLDPELLHVASPDLAHLLTDLTHDVPMRGT